MKRVLRYLWRRRTTTLGYIQVTVAVLAAADGLFTPTTVKVLLLLNGLCVAWLGMYNNRKGAGTPEPGP